MIFIPQIGGISIREERNIFCGHLWEKGCREKNEDSLIFWHMRKGRRYRDIAVLCDGIGGLPMGEDASAYVVRQLANWFMSEGYRLPAKKQIFRIQQLCYQLHEELKAYGKERGIRLGTTATIVLMEENRIYWIHIGDCRLYLVGERKIRILTKEHQDEKGNLKQAIGAGEWHLPMAKSRRLHRGDKFLLCSDGFYRHLEAEELKVWGRRKVESDEEADRMLRQMYQRKMAMGEKDNISALYFGMVKKG